MPGRIKVINPASNLGNMVSVSDWANIKIRPDTRDQVRSLKRGGESYDELLQKMAQQYDPEQAREGNT